MLVVTSHLHVSAVKSTLYISLTEGNNVRLPRRSTQLFSTSKVRDSTDGGNDGEVAGGGRYRRRQALERQIGCFSVFMDDGDACVRCTSLPAEGSRHDMATGI